MFNQWAMITIGFALFAMFFGSGNLVFPILVGHACEGHFILATLGILLTGVFLPFLGVLGMILYKGDLAEFFKCFGKKGTFIFTLVALSLMGPFGVLARCLTVAHGAIQLILPNASLHLTSLTLCLIVFLLSINKSKIVSILGLWLTPCLLLTIFFIAAYGLQMNTLIIIDSNGLDAMKYGFFQGYQMMDLLAAFFFSTFVIEHLKTTKTLTERASLKIFLKAATLGAFLLSLVYFLLILLGWNYHVLLEDKQPQEMLGWIAFASLGDFAAPCVCILVVLACLTTAIVLTSLFADFFKSKVTKDRMTLNQSLIFTLFIGYFVSTFEFSGIAKVLGPLMDLIYPSLICLTCVNISHKFFGTQVSHWPITATVALKICCF